MSWSIGSTHFKVSLGTLTGLALGLFLFFRFGQGGSAALDRWLGSAPTEVRTNRKLLAQDSLHRHQSATLRKRLSDSLGTLLTVVKTQQAAGAQLLAQARTVPQLRAAAEVIARAGQTCASGLQLCQQRGDSLFQADSAHSDSLARGLQRATTTIATGVAVTECHLIHVGPVRLFGCPSRTTAFKAGAVGGIGVVELFRWLLTHKL